MQSINSKIFIRTSDIKSRIMDKSKPINNGQKKVGNKRNDNQILNVSIK